MLGTVQRAVGATEQGVQALAGMPLAEAKADGDLQALAFDFMALFGALLAQFFGQVVGGLAVGVLQQQDELLATPAAENVGLAQRAAQLLGEIVQHLVAGKVAVLVVDQLEVVERSEERRVGKECRL